MENGNPNIDAIKASAELAAQQNLTPTEACKFAFGSPAARLWMTMYAREIDRLTQRERARADPFEPRE